MYQFVDVSDSPAGAILPAEALKINGKYIENEISGYRTLHVSGREILESEVNDQQIGNKDGTHYLNKRYPSRIITVTYQLICGSNVAFREAFNKLNSLIHVENTRLIFNDEKDKYFIGNASSVGAVEPGRNSVIGTIDFYCHDPYKHAVSPATVSNDGTEKIVEVTNNGTEDAYLDIECSLKSDNGALAFVANGKAFQVGNFDEIDGNNVQHSDGALWSPMTTKGLASWTSTNVILGNKSILQQGVMVSSGDVDFYGHTIVSDYGSASETVYHGPAKMIELLYPGKDVSTTWVPLITTEGAGVYTGYLQMCLIADDGTVPAYVEFAISNPQIRQGECHIYVNNVLRWKFGLSFPSEKGYIGLGAPYININKDGDTVSVVVGGNTLKFKDPDIVDKVINRLSFQHAKWMNNVAARNEMYVVAAYKNYTTWNDVPNFMKNADKVEIKSEDYEAKINGNPISIAQGSEPLKIPPGTWNVEVLYSDFATVPEFKVTVKEVWS